MKMKRILCVLLVFLMLVNSNCFVYAAENSGTETDVVDNQEMSADEAETGNETETFETEVITETGTELNDSVIMDSESVVHKSETESEVNSEPETETRTEYIENETLEPGEDSTYDIAETSQPIGENDIKSLSSDVTKPVVYLDSLNVDTKQATKGDQITVSVKVTDNVSSICYVAIVFQQPITQNTVYKTMDYNAVTDRYELILNVDDSFESGLWKIKNISANDNADNTTNLYNKLFWQAGNLVDLSAGDFEITGTTSDIIKPDIHLDTLNVNAKQAAKGDRVTLSIQITDNVSSLCNVAIIFQQPITQNDIYKTMKYNSVTDRYEVILNVDDSFESGLWRIHSISAKDNADNTTKLYNKLFWQAGNLVDLSAGDFEITGTASDIIKPDIHLDTLNVNAKQATKGDRVTVSIQISDNESSLCKVSIIFLQPITKKDINKTMKYNSVTDRYEVVLNVDDSFESGLWQIHSIHATDNADNTTKLYNKLFWQAGNLVDLSAGDFEVSEIAPDSVAPELDIDSIHVNNAQIILGQDYVYKMKVTDDSSGVKSVKAHILKPDGTTFESILEAKDGNIYQGTIKCNDIYNLGNWTFQSIVLEDNAGNQRSYDTFMDKFNFNVYREIDNILPIENTTVYIYNITEFNVIIWGDIYVAPNAVLTLNNATVYGNIYVLGGLSARNVTTNSIYGTSFVFGGETTQFSNGMVHLTGNNNISNIESSNRPIENIPIRLTNDSVKSIDGILHMSGATLDIAEMYVNNKRIDTSHTGRFLIDDINIDDAESVKVSWHTVWGYSIDKVYPVDRFVTSESGGLNQLPVINAGDKTIRINEDLDLLQGVSAFDAEDGDITQNIKIDKGDFDSTRRGTYPIVYSITDKSGSTVQKSVIITVIDPKILSIKLNENNLEFSCTDLPRQLYANIEEQDGPVYHKLTWSSSDENVVTVNDDGYLSLKSIGEATITVRISDTLFDTCRVKISHIWNAEPTVETQASCDLPGSESIHCSICNIVKPGSEQPIPAIGHNWSSDYTTDLEATCLSKGRQSIHCSVCNTIKPNSEQEIPLAEHAWSSLPLIDQNATCESPGSQSIHCTVCNTKKPGSEQQLPLSDHSWMIYPTVDKIPTCQENGIQSIHCLLCDVVKDGSQQNLDKSEHSWAYTYTIDKESTCQKNGLQSIHCTICNESQPGSQTAAPLAPHSYKNWTILSNSGCVANGLKVRFCNKCNVPQEQVIPPNGHKWASKATIDAAATCLAGGFTSIHCLNCPSTKNSTRTSKVSHSYGSWKVNTSPTIFKTGSRTKTCKWCKKGVKETLPKLKAYASLNVTSTILQEKKSTTAVKLLRYVKGDKVSKWSSSNTKVATVNKTSGKITAKKSGTAYITVTMKSGASAKCKIKVQKKRVETKKLSFALSSKTVKKGYKAKLHITRVPVTATEKLTFKSSNPKVMTISSNGTVRAIAKGKVTITVTSSNKKKATCKFQINN